MSFNKTYIHPRLRLFSRIIFLLCSILLTACASKQAKNDTQALPSAAELQAQQELKQFNYALSLLEGGDAQRLEAKVLFDQLYQANPSYLGALINSADISYGIGEFEEAKALYLQVLEQIPGSTSENVNLFAIHTYNQFGLIERQTGQFEQAETYYRQALELDGDNPVTVKNLAILLDLYRGKLVEAYALYQHYQELVGDAEPKVKDWLYDVKSRLPEEESNE